MSELYPTSDSNPTDLSHIKGTTLEVYYYLVENQGEYGPRTIQQELNLSSSSVASYHLNRLLTNKLVEKTPAGKYYVNEVQKIGRLQDSILFAGKYVPRIYTYVFYALINMLFSIILFFVDADKGLWLAMFLASNIGLILLVLKDANAVFAQLNS